MTTQDLRGTASYDVYIKIVSIDRSSARGRITGRADSGRVDGHIVVLVSRRKTSSCIGWAELEPIVTADYDSIVAGARWRRLESRRKRTD